MNRVSGIFNSRADAERAIELLGDIDGAAERLVLLSPGTEDEDVEEVVPEPESGTPVRREKMGTAMGRGMGIAGGIMLGGAVEVSSCRAWVRSLRRDCSRLRCWVLEGRHSVRRWEVPWIKKLPKIYVMTSYTFTKRRSDKGGAS